MLLNIRSWADARAVLYTLLPIVSTLLVSTGVLPDHVAKLWVALATSILGPVVAAWMARTVSALRTAFYAVLAAVQGLAVGYGLISDGALTPWMPLVVALVGAASGGVAVANTDTTPAAGPAIATAPTDCGSK